MSTRRRMQKKVFRLLVIVVVGFLAYTSLFYRDKADQLNEAIIYLKEEGLHQSDVNQELSLLLDESKSLVDEMTLKIEEQELYLDNYESILLDFAKENTFDTFLLLERRNKKLVVATDEGLLTVPYHGNVYTNDDAYQIIVGISNRDLNYRTRALEVYNQIPVDVRRIISPNGYPTAYLDDTMTIEVKTKDEAVFQIDPIRKWRLDMVSDTINVKHEMPDKGSDYFPLVDLELEYNGGFEGEGFIESYHLVEGGYLCRNQQNTAMGSDYTLEVKSDGIYMTALSNDDIGYEKMNKKLLPSDIYKGATWQVGDYTYEIEQIDVLVQVPAGIYKTIKVVTNHQEPKTFYYAPGLGLVRIEFYGLVEELIDIRIVNE